MHRGLLFLTLLSLLLASGIGWAQVGGEFAGLENRVAADPQNQELRRTLAAGYAASGFVEEAMEQYLALLRTVPSDAEARAGAAKLLVQQMPKWLPPGIVAAELFPLDGLTLSLPGGRAAEHRFLITKEGFPAHEGERQDRTHEWRFSRIAYGYEWGGPRVRRWQMKARVHWSDPAGAEVAQRALKLVLALYGTVRTSLDLDPARGGRVIDLWVCEGGTPGAFTAGTSIYLYAYRKERAPEEWVREIAHEFGHLALPGVGGFTKTDDPWADGELGELLFVKWLAASKAEWLPWSVAGAEGIACVRREQLMAQAKTPNPKLLDGADAKARDHLVGLALRVEAKAGPRFLAEVLTRCPRGNARRFVAEAEKLAKARGIGIW